MTAEKKRQILLASRPRGEPGPDNFELVETAVRHRH
jgi:NADPH-dependent curcumin reductase CurA